MTTKSPTHRRVSTLLTAATIAVAALTAGTAVQANAASTTLTNGGTVTARGIPSSGFYVGGALGLNDDVTTWESTAGTLGVRRTYFSGSQVSNAVNMAKGDVAKKRIPWISFKLPYSWADMAAGKGDAWAKDIAVKMKAIDGPIWLAFHHEPEAESGDLQQWKKTQERLGPIVRSNAPNVAFTVILMGYHQFMGTDPKYSMTNLWPNTTVDVAGFDIYERYGVVKNGTTDTKWTDFNAYFTKIKDWSTKSGVKWALAETGYSDPASKQKPKWIQDTSKLMGSYGGIAFTYFNSVANSKAHWELGTTAEKNDFSTANKAAPRLK